jgi:MFS transporter, FSR family, fosmidomycin resistance protein
MATTKAREGELPPAADDVPDDELGTVPAEPQYNPKATANIAAAHFSHDLYSSLLGPLIAAVQDKLAISLFVASLMVPAQQMPSVLQPFIGVLADRTSKRWFVVLAPGVAGISTSSIGLAPHIGIVLIMLLVSGLASAAFHTPAVALVGEYGGKKMGQAMAIFMAGGELARAVGPLMITGAIALFTLEGAWVLMVFGVVSSILLYFTLDTSESDAAEKAKIKVPLKPLLRARRKPILALLGYSAVKNLASAPFAIFLVVYLVSRGHSTWYASISLSTLFVAGIAGGFLGGTLSDRFGRRNIMFITAILTAPLYYLYLWLENGTWYVLPVLGVAGIISMATRPIQLALAQEVLPEARGPMAGVMLAFGFVSMSLIALAFGALSDAIGIENSFWLLPGTALFALPLIAMLPRHGEALKQPEPV